MPYQTPPPDPDLSQLLSKPQDDAIQDEEGISVRYAFQLVYESANRINVCSTGVTDILIIVATLSFAACLMCVENVKFSQ